MIKTFTIKVNKWPKSKGDKKDRDTMPHFNAAFQLPCRPK